MLGIKAGATYCCLVDKNTYEKLEAVNLTKHSSPWNFLYLGGMSHWCHTLLIPFVFQERKKDKENRKEKSLQGHKQITKPILCHIMRFKSNSKLPAK